MSLERVSCIDQLLENAIGTDLYHYTSSEGLLGILQEGKIRCSHIFYLNDMDRHYIGDSKGYYHRTYTFETPLLFINKNSSKHTRRKIQ